jgi:hypothetical protein
MRYLFLLLLISCNAVAQNLMEERIWKISPRKKSIFLDSGVFHHQSEVNQATISGIRTSGKSNAAYERLVIDFNTNSVPRIYGHVSQKDKKISIDFFNTSVAGVQTSLKNSKNISGIDFLNIDGKTTSVSLSMKGKASFDIFYLENPGRLVIDIR